MSNFFPRTFKFEIQVFDCILGRIWNLGQIRRCLYLQLSPRASGETFGEGFKVLYHCVIVTSIHDYVSKAVHSSQVQNGNFGAREGKINRQGRKLMKIRRVANRSRISKQSEIRQFVRNFFLKDPLPG
ncbi:hypothetical protein AVEN_220837-1 [Araneus ventricosus]|uniref:Uncharacterized protein n=1 Tax=Araneus ventricosus TaxID=182803 RepID=A0A4Y2FP99_ARAVE|nr:hypothetical protein AVEN_220837-1 [Araneus ventricosus]